MREEQTPLFRRMKSSRVEYDDERERERERGRKPDKRMKEE